MRTKMRHFESRTCVTFKTVKQKGKLRAGGTLISALNKHQEPAYASCGVVDSEH